MNTASHASYVFLDTVAAGRILFAIQLRIVFFNELPNLIAEIQQPLPLLGIKGYGHALQTVDADSPLLADFAGQLTTLLVIALLQELLSLLDIQLTRCELR